MLSRSLDGRRKFSYEKTVSLTFIRSSIHGLSNGRVRFNRLFYRLPVSFGEHRAPYNRCRRDITSAFLQKIETKSWQRDFLSLSLTLTLSPGFSLFFVFSPFLSLLFAVIEGITDLFVVPAARYTVASLFRNKMDFAHSGNDRNQYCSSAFRMMMHRIQIFPDSLVRC